MNLTKDEKDTLFNEYKPKLDRLVGCFHGLVPFDNKDWEDFRQEAYLAFMEQVQRKKDREELRRTYFYAVISQLFYYHERCFPLHISHRNFYHDFKKIRFVLFGDLENDDRMAVEDDGCLPACFDEYLDSLTEEQREMMRLHWEGLDQKDIQERLKQKSADYTYRQFRKMRKKFSDCFSETSEQEVV